MAGEHAKGHATGARRGFLSDVGRRWPWMVGGTVAALIGSAAFVLAVPPRYAAVATVLPGEPDRSAPGAVTAPTETLAAQDLARAAVDRLGLAANPEFSGEGASGQTPADAFGSRLTVTPALGSRAIAITFASRDPELAARGANTVAELAVQSLNEARARSLRALATWLAGKIEDGKTKVADAEAKVEAARAGSGEDGKKAGADEASDLNAKLAAARADQSTAVGKATLLRNLERDGRLADAPPSIVGESLRRLLDQRVSLRAEIADASWTLLPLHPRMKDLAARLTALDGQIREAAEQAARASEAEARHAGDEADAIASTLAQQSMSAATAPDEEAPVRALEAETQSARDELTSYEQMAREQEARGAAEAETGEARIGSRAEPPRAAVFSKVAPILVASAVAGFVLSGLAAVIAALAGARRKHPPSPHAAPVAPAAVTASVVAPDAAGPADVDGLSPNPSAPPPAGALDSAAGIVAKLRKVKPRGGVVVLVAGDRTGQALSVALDAARRLAAERAAVFVDLGDTQDWLADILYREAPDVSAIPGLSDLFADRVGFGDVIRRDLSSNLDVVLPGGDRAGGKIDDALTAFAAAYDAVVLHASDWRSDWARAAAGFADAVIVVTPSARTGTVLEQARHALGDACATILAYGVQAPQRMSEAA
jgi:uncharacterized protein involved in exopolysaccharide biosynthesis